MAVKSHYKACKQDGLFPQRMRKIFLVRVIRSNDVPFAHAFKPQAISQAMPKSVQSLGSFSGAQIMVRVRTRDCMPDNELGGKTSPGDSKGNVCAFIFRAIGRSSRFPPSSEISLGRAWAVLSRKISYFSTLTMKGYGNGRESVWYPRFRMLACSRDICRT